MYSESYQSGHLRPQDGKLCWGAAENQDRRHQGGTILLKQNFFFLRFYLFTFRKRGRKGEREGEQHRCINWLPLSHAPNWGPGPQPRHMPWLGIELATFQFAGQHSIHWATPARAISHFIYKLWVGTDLLNMITKSEIIKIYFTEANLKC